MRRTQFYSLCCLGCLVAAPAIAYDPGKDFATCTEGKGGNKAIVKACTNLIDNAASENELVGYFYAMRAAANDDKPSNCRDARKVLDLTANPAFVKGANAIIETNC